MFGPITPTLIVLLGIGVTLWMFGLALGIYGLAALVDRFAGR